jgi:quinoprotein glucose dehydrogenase
MVEPLTKVLAENDDSDPVLRHAAVMGLSAARPSDVLAAAIGHSSAAVRRAAVAALRRMQSPLISGFLTDESVLVAEEAARAIHDVPLENCMADLAAQIERFPQSISFTHRALNAAYRLGSDEFAQRILRVALDMRFDAMLRKEALIMLSKWSAPLPRDRVLGMWRPIPARDGAPAARALAQHFSDILESGDESLIAMSLDAVAALTIAEASKPIEELLNEKTRPAQLRARAMMTLKSLRPDNLRTLAESGVNDDSPDVRIAARDAFVAVDPVSASNCVLRGVESKDMRERQAAIGLLPKLPMSVAEPSIVDLINELERGEVPADSRLEIVECAQLLGKSSQAIRDLIAKHAASAGGDPAAAFRECLEGGDADKGKTIFFERVQVNCVRCHRIGDRGGAVGPDLSEIGGKKDRQYLLESLIDPNRTIAEKFETVVILTDQGKTISGILQAETGDFIRLTTADGNLIVINKVSIDERRRGKSAMPDDVSTHMSPRDVRDLVEFLARQKPTKPDSSNEPARPADNTKVDAKSDK